MPLRAARPRALMDMHLRVLFTHDARQRLTGINQWNGGIAPRFFLGRTPEGNIWRFRADLEDDFIDILDALCREEPPLPQKEPRHKARYLELLSLATDDTRLWQGPAYYRTTAISTSAVPLVITRHNDDLLRGGFEDWLPDVPHWQPFMAVRVDDKAVALCASVRQIKGAHEAGVATLAAYQRQGYASQAVASWANQLIAQGIIPLYSTSWHNKASQAVAERLGFCFYGSDFHIT